MDIRLGEGRSGLFEQGMRWGGGAFAMRVALRVQQLIDWDVLE